MEQALSSTEQTRQKLHEELKEIVFKFAKTNDLSSIEKKDCLTKLREIYVRGGLYHDYSKFDEWIKGIINHAKEEKLPQEDAITNLTGNIDFFVIIAALDYDEWVKKTKSASEDSQNAWTLYRALTKLQSGISIEIRNHETNVTLDEIKEYVKEFYSSSKTLTKRNEELDAKLQKQQAENEELDAKLQKQQAELEFTQTLTVAANTGYKALTEEIKEETLKNDNLKSKTDKVQEDVTKIEKALNGDGKGNGLIENVEEATKKVKNMQQETVLIISIFAAIVLAVTGGLSYLSIALQGMSTTPFLKSAFFVLLCGFVIFNAVYVLMYMASKIAGRSIYGTCFYTYNRQQFNNPAGNGCVCCLKEKKCWGIKRIQRRLPYVFWFNFIIFILISFTVGLYVLYAITKMANWSWLDWLENLVKYIPPTTSMP